MRLIPIDKLPEKRKKRSAQKDLEKLLFDFMGSPAKVVLVEIDSDDYKDAVYCRTSLKYAVQRYKYPVNVHYRQGKVYLVKKA